MSATPESPRRAALVTGASRGIGLALATALAEDGYAVTMVARRHDSLEAAAGSLREAGHEISVHAADVGSEAALIDVVAAHRERFGRLDVLVNNAGVGIGAGVGDQASKAIDLQLNVNLRSVVILYRECLELLRADGGAHVFNLSSVTAKAPQPFLSVYSATKAAILAYTESMNRELIGDGIRSTALCPAFVDTDMTAFAHDAVPPEQMISVTDIAAAMRFVLSLSPAALVGEIVVARSGDVSTLAM